MSASSCSREAAQPRVIASLCALLLCACAPSAESDVGADRDASALSAAADPQASAPMPAAPIASTIAVDAVPAAVTARPALCAHPGADAVRDVFCAAAPPRVGSLAELHKALSFDVFRQRAGGSYEPTSADAGIGIAGDAGIVLTLSASLLAHSTALSGRLVSQINPRAILMNERIFMTFQRGTQRVELATVDRDTQRLTFYLLSFTQACNARASGCLPGELYTPRIESDWTSITLHDDEELKNTPSDCRQCHQRGRERPTLLMRELSGPWTHFFSHDRDLGVDVAATPEPTGRDLVLEFRRARGDEAYAGVPAEMLRGTLGLALETRVGADQPLLFDGTTIMRERWGDGAQGFPSAPGRSATWDRNYEAFKRGEQMALPYHDTRATDPGKLAALTEAYTAYRAGTLPLEQLPDLSDIFPDDPRVRAEIGLQTDPSATPAEALIQACGGCHNDVLDQSLTRARFSVAITRLGRAERELAIARLSLSAGEPGVMPPPESRQLDAAARAALIAYLEGPTPPEDAARLEHAAVEGMAQESRKPTRGMQ